MKSDVVITYDYDKQEDWLPVGFRSVSFCYFDYFCPLTAACLPISLKISDSFFIVLKDNTRTDPIKFISARRDH